MDENVLEMPSLAVASAYTHVMGHRIHYIEAGQGEPIVFVHGNPTSSYVWRNVIPVVAQRTGRRCIALDLLGFGKSDKPPGIRYSIRLHADLLAQFIDTLGLRNVVLVAEDWGGPLSVSYATHHPHNVAGVAVMETLLWTMDWQADLPLRFRIAFWLFRSPLGFPLIQVFNIMTKKSIPAHCPIAPEAIDHYVNACPTVRSRRAMRMLPKLIPMGRGPKESIEFFDEFRAKIAATAWPFVWFVATPGFIPTHDHPSSFRNFEAFRRLVPRLQVKDFGPGNHFLSEENPQRVAQLLAEWIHEALPKNATARAASA